MYKLYLVVDTSELIMAVYPSFFPLPLLLGKELLKHFIFQYQHFSNSFLFTQYKCCIKSECVNV